MRKTMFGVMSALALIAAPVFAQQNPTQPAPGSTATPQAGQAQTDQTQTLEAQAEQRGRRQAGQRGPAMRASDLNGMEVRNAQNEDLGTIHDLVIDLQTGQVRYAALQSGGVLGVGGDLYAVPWSAFRLQRTDDDDYHLLLNATSQQFENAPGFDDDNWPNMADPQWRTTNDAYYNESGISTPRREGNRGRGPGGVRPDGDRVRPEGGVRSERGIRSGAAAGTGAGVDTGTTTGDLPERGDRIRTQGDQADAADDAGSESSNPAPQRDN